MLKISNAKIAEVLSEAASQLRTITAERDALSAKLAHIERRSEATKVAQAMQDKGLTSEPIDHLVENLEKMAADGKLQNLADAVDLVGPDMWSKVAQTTNDIPRGLSMGSGMNDLERYLSGELG